MNLEGRICRLRAVEPRDVDTMYAWENDTEIWAVSGTTAPYSRELLERFVEQQQFDIWQTRQVRLMIEPILEADALSPCPATGSLPVGALDLFEFDPQHRRAGVGILVHDPAQRGKGYAADALTVACEYAREVLGLHQLWCSVGAENAASLSLFRHAGFSEIGIKRDWQWTAYGFRDEVLMQKIL